MWLESLSGLSWWCGWRAHCDPGHCSGDGNVKLTQPELSAPRGSQHLAGWHVSRGCYHDRTHWAGNLISQVFSAFASSPCAEIISTFSLGWPVACLDIQSRAAETFGSPQTWWRAGKPATAIHQLNPDSDTNHTIIAASFSAYFGFPWWLRQ